MNALHFQKLNPHFKFNRIFLYNQAGFNRDGTMKKIIIPLNHAGLHNKYINELPESKKLDYNSQNLLSKYRNEIYKNNNINGRYDAISSPKKKIKILRPKLLKSSNLLKKIDFNLNISEDLNDSTELNISPYNSERKNLENSFSNKSKNKLINLTEINNNVVNLKNKNNISITGIEQTETGNIKLPFINNKKNTNINSSFNNINDSQIQNKTVEINNIDKNINNKNTNFDENSQKDIFKNVNHSIENKKTKLKVNDIQRSIDDYKRMNKYIDKDENLDSKIFINTKLLKSTRKKLNFHNFDDDYSDNSMSEEMLKRKEKDKYMLYEKNKKFIDKNKICDSMKYRASIIPNLNLDKDFRKVKQFESIVTKMKRAQIELPYFRKANK